MVVCILFRGHERYSVDYAPVPVSRPIAAIRSCRQMSQQQQPTATNTASRRPIAVVLIDDDETWVRTQRRLLERDSENLHVSTATSYEKARSVLERTSPDCVVCDYQLGDGTGLDLLTEIRTDAPTLPFILVTGEGDEQVASAAISAQVTDYIRKVALGQQPTKLVRRIENVVSAERTRQALAREREHKQALLDMVTSGSTRTDFGQQLCEHLVTAHDYACAWIGILDENRAVVPLATAGDTGYLDTAITPGKDPHSETEPSLTALAAAEPVVRSLDVSSGYSAADASTDGHWKASAADYGFRSVAALPLVYEEVCFGVLCVYSRTESLTSDVDQSVLSEYAQTAGYVFRTAAWQETLLSAANTTIEFTLTDGHVPLLDLMAVLPAGVTFETRTVIPRSEDEVLYLCTVDGVSVSELAEVAAEVETINSIEQYGTPDDDQCGIVAATPVPERRLVDAGVSLERTVVEAGAARITVVLGEETTLQQCLDTLETVTVDDSVTTRWTTHDTSPESEASTPQQLTDRQREVVELAVEAGYFERPRRNNTGELASVLDISRATFTQHLRAAQRKLLTGLLYE